MTSRPQDTIYPASSTGHPAQPSCNFLIWTKRIYQSSTKLFALIELFCFYRYFNCNQFDREYCKVEQSEFLPFEAEWSVARAERGIKHLIRPGLAPKTYPTWLDIVDRKVKPGWIIKDYCKSQKCHISIVQCNFRCE